MRKVDFCISYEVKRREIEYLTLLKLELEKRGYSVSLVPANSISNVRNPLYDAEVSVDAGFGLKHANFGKGILYKKSIELTSEQILNNYQVRFFLDERDKLEKEKAVVAWGEAIRRRLINVEKMPENRVFALGSMDLDFIKPRFKDFDLSRDEISKQFSLDNEKTWNLFISSFSLVKPIDDDDGEVLDEKYNNRSERIYPTEKRTRAIIREWFKKVLIDNPDRIIIYRPHPVEQLSDKFLQMEKEYDNFYIIRDHSVRQWIKICDKCYNWYSTSGVQAYLMNKPFYVLRPVPVDSELDLENYKNAKGFITDFEAFENSYIHDEYVRDNCPFDSSIYEYYRYDEKEYSYELVADLCEEVFKNDEYLIPKEYIEEFRQNVNNFWKNSSLKANIACWSRRTPLYRLYHDIFSPRVSYPNIIKQEQTELESLIRKCMESDDAQF